MLNLHCRCALVKAKKCKSVLLCTYTDRAKKVSTLFYIKTFDAKYKGTKLSAVFYSLNCSTIHTHISLMVFKKWFQILMFPLFTVRTCLETSASLAQGLDADEMSRAQQH